MLQPPPSLHKLVTDDLKSDWQWKSWLNQVYRESISYQAGSATLASGTATVTFTENVPDTNFSILLGGNANETFYWSSKATTGFTINSSNGTSTATVDWTIVSY